MSPNRPRSYQITTAAQWRECVVHGLEIGADGGLYAMAPLGSRAISVTEGVVADIVATDRYGQPMWRTMAADPGALPVLQRHDVIAGTVQSLELTGVAACSPRWVADRQGLWGFGPGSTTVERYALETLDADLALDVADSCSEGGKPRLAEIVDIASDAMDGLWLMVAVEDGLQRLLHVDCSGTARQCWNVPCAVGRACRLGTTLRGSAIVVLGAGGQHLAFIDAADGTLQRVVQPMAGSMCGPATLLATDGRNRIVLWSSRTTATGIVPCLFVLDGGGDAIDGPLEALFGASPPSAVNDVAVHADAVWFATASGVWRLDSSAQSGARAADGELLTPALASPPSDAGRGWLRAEVDIDLPRGAAIEAWIAGSDDARIVDQATSIAHDSSLTSARRQSAIRDLLDAGPRRTFAGPSIAGVPIAVPLFEVQQRWLWLGLRIVTPPGAQPPALRALRVLYPDVSLERQLPSIFKGPVNDPDGFLRRLVGVLEALTQSFDARIRTLGANVAPATAPADWLDFLASWLDLPWDNALPEAVKRALLNVAGELVARRATRAGLSLLLHALVDDAHGSVVIADLTVDHVPMTLGGAGCPGIALPQLLAGVSPRAATLGGKAVLGRARLMCDATECDPLQMLVPTLRIELFADPPRRKVLAPIVGDLLRAYLPAGVRVSVQWAAASATRDLLGEAGLLVDGDGFGALGTDSQIGRMTLAGRVTGRIDDAGLAVGLQLQ